MADPYDKSDQIEVRCSAKNCGQAIRRFLAGKRLQEDYAVGEKGPELYAPSAPGRIIPNGAGGQAQWVQGDVTTRTEPSAMFVQTVDARVRQSETRMPAMLANRQQRYGSGMIHRINGPLVVLAFLLAVVTVG